MKEKKFRNLRFGLLFAGAVFIAFSVLLVLSQTQSTEPNTGVLTSMVWFQAEERGFSQRVEKQSGSVVPTDEERAAYKGVVLNG